MVLEIDLELLKSEGKDLDNYIQEIVSNVENSRDAVRNLSADSLEVFKSGTTTPENLSRGSSHHSIELGCKIMKEQSPGRLIPESTHKNNQGFKDGSIKR